LLNLRHMRASNPRATHGNTLVMLGSLAGGEDQGAGVPAADRSYAQLLRRDVLLSEVWIRFIASEITALGLVTASRGTLA